MVHNVLQNKRYIKRLQLHVTITMTSLVLDCFEDSGFVYDTSRNTTRNRMTKFEFASIVGKRLEQVARGGQVYVDDAGVKNIRDIVIMELKQKRIPFIVARTIPTGVKEYFKVEDLVVDALL